MQNESNVALASDASTGILDPFDPTRLRLSQDFGANLGVKKMLTAPVRKPSKEWWFQTHPDESYRIQTYVVDLKEDREVYLVNSSLWEQLSCESTFGPRVINTSMTRQGVLFMWPIRLPGPDGKLDDWNASALDAAERASGNWIRMASNMNLGAYDVFETTANWPTPQWPTEPLSDLLRIAFKNRYIDSLKHPVLKRLRGEG